MTYDLASTSSAQPLTENPRVGGSIPPLGTFLDTTTLTFTQLATAADSFEIPKAGITSEEAHVRRMSAFEADEHLRGVCWGDLSRIG